MEILATQTKLRLRRQSVSLFIINARIKKRMHRSRITCSVTVSYSSHISVMQLSSTRRIEGAVEQTKALVTISMQRYYFVRFVNPLPSNKWNLNTPNVTSNLGCYSNSCFQFQVGFIVSLTTEPTDIFLWQRLVTVPKLHLIYSKGRSGIFT